MDTSADQQLLSELTAAVKGVIARVAKLPPDSLGDDVLLFPGLAADMGIDTAAPDYQVNPEIALDSLDLLDMLVVFEQAFEMKYDIGDLESSDVPISALATPRLIARYMVDTLEPAKIQQGLHQLENL